ncbi:MAG: inverse autotransporter beta domain-containing protein [Phormidesmis sp.]
MKLSVWLTYIATLLVTLLSAAPSARADEAAAATQNVVRPRFGLDFDSASGGAEPFTQFESFVPIWQKVGSDLVFFQGQLSFDTDANLGTNLQLGYRHFVPSDERIYGGYLAFDKRGTNAASFDQLGVGLETLGENWDVRLNGYLPLGDRRALVNSNTVDAGTQISDLAFVGNLLTATSTPRQADIRDYEAALGGFDLEVGSKLLDIGEQGALRGYGGLYYYDGPAVGGSLGWRVRLQAEPTNYLRTGLAVQNDDIFGTNVRFNIGAVLPQRRSARTASGEVDRVRSRLGESIGRDGHIVVDRQREAAVEEIESDAITAGPVTNPATGQPWFFNHVVEGVSGDGTFEAPYGDLEGAIATAPTDGNGIVYVTDSATLSGPFTLPGGIQLLSSGPEQFVDAYSGSTQIQLPFSGSGEFPLISGAVALNSSADSPTVLSGFTVEDAIAATTEGTTESTTEDTEDTSEEINGGIFADNSLGEVIIRDNVVTTAGNGIEVASEGSETAGGVTISGNSVTGEQAGIGVNTYEATLTGNTVISDNVVGGSGIQIDAYSSARIGNLTISGNTVTTDNTVDSDDRYSNGISFSSRESNVDGDVVISGNVVDASATGIAAGYSYSELEGKLTISDNTIGTEGTETAPSAGVTVISAGSRVGDRITISGNTVNAQSVGIGVINYSYGPGSADDAREIEPGLEGGITITGNTDINVAGNGSRRSFFPGNSSVGIGVFNGQGSRIAGGVNINENGPVRVTGDEETSTVGITVINSEGTIEGGVTIANNAEIVVSGADTSFSGSPIPSPGDFGTVGIAVGNNSYSYGPSTIEGGITISGNTAIDSSEYGIAVVNNSTDSGFIGPSFPTTEGAGAMIIGDITVTENGVTSVDDSVLIVNLDEVAGSVSLSNNLLTSIEDDGIDFSNLVVDSIVNGDLAFSNNIVQAAGDDVKCTDNGTITGTISPSSVVCQSSIPN